VVEGRNSEPLEKKEVGTGRFFRGGAHFFVGNGERDERGGLKKRRRLSKE
jgi:hypothetical protein